MDITICTIGFAGKTARQLFELLQSAGVRKVIDVRESRGGQLSGFAKYPDLEFFLEKIAGIGYEHAPALAPSAEIRKAYRQSLDWPLYESQFLELMRQRGVPENVDSAGFQGTVVLLCSEPGPEKCHRRLVAGLLSEHWRGQGHRVQIQHLVIAESGAKSKRKPRAK